MVIIKTPELQQDLGPAEMTLSIVQYWCHHTQQFANTQIGKAKEFVKNNCYEYVGEGFFLCHPIAGYNTRTYEIRKNSITKEFDCNCQRGREGSAKCSHVLGLYFMFKLNYFRKKDFEEVKENV